MSGKEIVKMSNIHKSFPGVKALKGVNFSVHEGEVHGLIGENGAGKSTLIKILMGVYSSTDAGKTYIYGKEAVIKNPKQARSLGLGAVYQDLNIVPHLSVGENFFLGKFPVNKMGLIDWRKVFSITEQVLKELNLNINPKIKFKNLSAAKQEMVSIAKIVHEKSKLIVFDEPTALLTNKETAELFELIKDLKKKEVGVIYISHRLEEIFEVCDTVTILRDGEWIKTIPVSSTNEDELISFMVGRTIGEMYSIKHFEPKEKILEVKNLTKKPIFENISFEIYRKEILGLFGLVGSGRTDIVKCIFGAEKLDTGKIFINNKEIKFKAPKHAIDKGIGFLPEDKKLQGLAINLNIITNINLASYDLISKIGFINTRREKENANNYVNRLQIKTPSIQQKVINLSGGNQQKVVISKWLCRNSNIFILDELTTGVDVGVKVEIFKIIEQLLEKGNSIILISSYLPEIMGLADRIVVISEGKEMGIIPRNEFNEESILKLASGIKNNI